MKLIWSKRYGGGISDLNKNRLPVELQYLFQNKYLDCMRILILVKEFQKRKKGVMLNEILYYFTLVEMISGNEDEFRVDNTYFQENYLVNEKRISDYIVILANQQYITVHVDKTSKKSIIFIKNSIDGNNVVVGLENDYFKQELILCKYAIDVFKYGITAQRKAMSKYEKQD